MRRVKAPAQIIQKTKPVSFTALQREISALERKMKLIEEREVRAALKMKLKEKMAQEKAKRKHRLSEREKRGIKFHEQLAYLKKVEEVGAGYDTQPPLKKVERQGTLNLKRTHGFLQGDIESVYAKREAIQRELMLMGVSREQMKEILLYCMDEAKKHDRFPTIGQIKEIFLRQRKK